MRTIVVGLVVAAVMWGTGREAAAEEEAEAAAKRVPALGKVELSLIGGTSYVLAVSENGGGAAFGLYHFAATACRRFERTCLGVRVAAMRDPHDRDELSFRPRSTTSVAITAQDPIRLSRSLSLAIGYGAGLSIAHDGDPDVNDTSYDAMVIFPHSLRWQVAPRVALELTAAAEVRVRFEQPVLATMHLGAGLRVGF